MLGGCNRENAMSKTNKAPVLVVLQLTGGNDYMNTVIPYADPNYYDSRPVLGIPEADVLKLDDQVGFHPSMGAMKEIYDQGDMAIVHGVGYQNPSRSHFRSMDIWHTAEPDNVTSEGWLGKVIRELDPGGENPVTAVNIGQGLPRALVAPGAAVSCVADLSTHGLLTGIEQEAQRTKMLDRFAAMYAPAVSTGVVTDYLRRTGTDLLKGVDVLKSAFGSYSSSVEYASNDIASSLRDIAMIHLADLGARIFYTEHGSFDTHGAQAVTHAVLWDEASEAIADFWADLREHDADENVVMLLFSEFGRRVRDNGSGTDHGAAGVAFAIGPRVKGGSFGEYPETGATALSEGDLVSNLDFRSAYSNIVEDWLGLDSTPIVNGRFQHPGFIEG